jgi:hypothetical protein
MLHESYHFINTFWTIYVQANHAALNIIGKDFHVSGGICNLAISAQKWKNTMSGWAVPKNSPYTEAINIRYVYYATLNIH